MYDMYPREWPGQITQRACEAELLKWELEGAPAQEPKDFVDARTVSTAERAVADDAGRRERLGAQVAQSVMRAAEFQVE